MAITDPSCEWHDNRGKILVNGMRDLQCYILWYPIETRAPNLGESMRRSHAFRRYRTAQLGKRRCTHCWQTQLLCSCTFACLHPKLPMEFAASTWQLNSSMAKSSSPLGTLAADCEVGVQVPCRWWRSSGDGVSIEQWTVARIQRGCYTHPDPR